MTRLPGLTHYKLVGHTPVACELMEWAEFFQDGNRHVDRTSLPLAMISTVFLGIDHNWMGGPPHLFETMIFPVIEDREQIMFGRCSTWEQAEVMHDEAVKHALAQHVEDAG